MLDYWNPQSISRLSRANKAHYNFLKEHKVWVHWKTRIMRLETLRMLSPRTTRYHPNEFTIPIVNEILEGRYKEFYCKLPDKGLRFVMNPNWQASLSVKARTNIILHKILNDKNTDDGLWMYLLSAFGAGVFEEVFTEVHHSERGPISHFDVERLSTNIRAKGNTYVQNYKYRMLQFLKRYKQARGYK